MNSKCMEFGSLWALNKAISNVEKYYTVVGVLEMHQESLVVMEKLIPEFFDGIQEIYQKRNETSMTVLVILI